MQPDKSVHAHLHATTYTITKLSKCSLETKYMPYYKKKVCTNVCIYIMVALVIAL